MIIPIFLGGCSFNNKEEKLTNYTMNLQYEDNEKILYGNIEILYTNNSENMFEYLYFHLYPNAFREGAKESVVSISCQNEAYENGTSYGNIEIYGVYNKNNVLNYQITGDDQNILEVELPFQMYPDEKICLSIEFAVKLANINHRLGYGNNTINFGNFYPIVCVYEDGKGFYKDLYNSKGDPFYSECANYNVKITYPAKYEIASSGDLISTELKDENKQSNIEGFKIRDFSFVLSEKFSIVSDCINNTTIYYYGYKNDENLKSCLKIAVNAVETFNNLFGIYSYKQLSIVKSNFVHGGMEFPNMVLISDKYTQQIDLNYVIVHEIAHQWWYGIVGNDQYNHAWMDESLAEYSTLMFFRQNKSYGLDYKQLLNGAKDSYKLFEKVYTKITGNVDGRMDRSLNEFNTEPEYVQCVYTKGILFFNSIEELVGQKKFDKALNNYYEKYKYKNCCPADMISIFNKSTGFDMEEIFNSWLEGNVVIE